MALRTLKPRPIPRAAGISPRQVALSMGARFYDELMSGLPDVLMPTIRAQLGLSYTQISLLRLALDYVAAVAEPANGLLLDVWRRKWMMAWGAAGLGLSLILIGLAPTFLLLLLAYAIFGLSSGPLAHTGDVVLVEAYPEAPDRIYARATMLDTFGALLGPLLVSLAFWLRLPWRGLLLVVGLAGLIYALLILRTTFPLPRQHSRNTGIALWPTARQNLRLALTDQEARRWLLFLFAFAVLETPVQFETVWLAENAGMSQPLVALYRVVEMGTGIISLFLLDHWLTRFSIRHVLQAAIGIVALLYPAWLWLPGIWPRFLLGVPLGFGWAIFWPVARSRSLASLPGRAGMVTAISSLFGLVPLALLFGLLAEAVGLTRAMLAVYLLVIPLLAWLVWRLPAAPPEAAPAGPPPPGDKA